MLVVFVSLVLLLSVFPSLFEFFYVWTFFALACLASILFFFCVTSIKIFVHVCVYDYLGPFTKYLIVIIVYFKLIII